MIGPPPVCLGCKHWHWENEKGFTCDAFPTGDGVPQVIMIDGDPHTKEVPGDRGIRYEPIGTNNSTGR